MLVIFEPYFGIIVGTSFVRNQKSQVLAFVLSFCCQTYPQALDSLYTNSKGTKDEDGGKGKKGKGKDKLDALAEDETYMDEAEFAAWLHGSPDEYIYEGMQGLIDRDGPDCSEWTVPHLEGQGDQKGSLRHGAPNWPIGGGLPSGSPGARVDGTDNDRVPELSQC